MVKIGSGAERGFDDGVKLSRIANAPAIMTTQQPKIMAEKKFKKKVPSRFCLDHNNQTYRQLAYQQELFR